MGDQNIVVQDPNQDLFTRRNVNVTYPPGTVASLQMTTPGWVNAGVNFNVTITALDGNGNAVPSYAGAVLFSSSDPNALLPTPYTFNANDQSSHTFNTTLFAYDGNQTLSVQDANANLSVEQSLYVQAPGTAGLAFNVQAPSFAMVGAAFTFTVSAVSNDGNAITDYNGTLVISSGDANAVLPPPYTFNPNEQGVHTFTATFTHNGNRPLMLRIPTPIAGQASSSLSGLWRGLLLRSPPTRHHKCRRVSHSFSR